VGASDCPWRKPHQESLKIFHPKRTSGGADGYSGRNLFIFVAISVTTGGTLYLLFVAIRSTLGGCMSHDTNPLACLLTDATLRPILEEIGERLRMTEPAEVLRVALAILSTASEEKAARGARLLLEYPNGACKELRFWKQGGGPKLVARDGQLVENDNKKPHA
jgi:hypothetical protein